MRRARVVDYAERRWDVVHESRPSWLRSKARVAVTAVRTATMARAIMTNAAVQALAAIPWPPSTAATSTPTEPAPSPTVMVTGTITGFDTLATSTLLPSITPITGTDVIGTTATDTPTPQIVSHLRACTIKPVVSLAISPKTGQVPGGASLTATVRTSSRAQVTLTLIVQAVKAVTTNQGKQHTVVTTLYRRTAIGVADRNGHFVGTLAVTYQPLKTVSATLTVHVQLGCGQTSATRSVRILPLLRR